MPATVAQNFSNSCQWNLIFMSGVKKAKSPKNQRQAHRPPIAAGPAYAAGATEAHGNSSAITKSWWKKNLKWDRKMIETCSWKRTGLRGWPSLRGARVSGDWTCNRNRRHWDWFVASYHGKNDVLNWFQMHNYETRMKVGRCESRTSSLISLS